MDIGSVSLDFIERFLIWCFGFNAVLLTIWVLFLLVPGNFVYKAHSKIFSISKENFDAVHYAGITFYKVLIFGIFLVPYLVLKILL